MAGGTWDKLEQVFEDRVARALSKLGVHTQADVERLRSASTRSSDAVNASDQGAAAAGLSRSRPAREKVVSALPAPARRSPRRTPMPHPRWSSRHRRSASSRETQGSDLTGRGYSRFSFSTCLM